MFGPIQHKARTGLDFFNAGTMVSRRQIVNFPAGVLVDNQPANRVDANVAGLNVANTFTLGPQTIKTGADGNVAGIVQGNSATQSADLWRWQKITGNTRARITNNAEFSNPNPNDCTGLNNECFGLGAGGSLTSGANNTCVGNLAGNALTSGSEHVMIGNGAGALVQTGVHNIAIGRFALGSSGTAAGGNVCVGNIAGRNLTTNDNVAIGSSSLSNEASGAGHTAIGTGALFNANGASNDVCIGSSCGSSITTGSGNTCIGPALCANNLTTGGNNVIIGFEAGSQFATGAGTLSSGSSNTLVGNQASVTGNVSNAIALGSGAVGQANEFALSPNANFQTFYELDSTTTLTPRATFNITSISSSHGSNKYRISISAYDTAAREGIRVDATGSAALVGIGGAVDNAPVPALLNTNGMAKFTGGIGVPASAAEMVLTGGSL